MADVNGYGLRLRVDLIKITPRLAEEWLGANTHNRNLRNKRIAQYARDMREGRWIANGEPIIFARDGRLLDGQNRLHAVVLSRASVVMLIVRGLPSIAQETMDTGAARILSDVLKLRGEKNCANLSVILRQVYAYEQVGIPYVPKVNPAPSVNNAIAVLERYPELRDTINFAQSANNGKDIISVSSIATLHFLFSRVDAEISEVFFFHFGTGEDLIRSSPIYMLRERLMRDKMRGNVRLTPLTKLALVIKSFNAFYRGDTMNLLSWKSIENFPKIAGSDNVLLANRDDE